MKIDITEMMRIKGRLTDINNELNSTFKGINQEFDSISSNINSEGLHEAIITVQQNISTLSTMFANNMVSLEEFIGEQLSSYTLSNNNASESLQNLVNMVNQTFDENGNVISTAAITTFGANNTQTTPSSDTSNTNTSSRRADPNIADSTGYTAGEAKQDYFSNKIDNSQEKWDRVNEMYYYFKDKGLSDEQIAGVIGNVTQESALDLLCPTGQYKGLFQWERSRYPSDWDFNTQLDHAWEEISQTRYNGKVLEHLSEQTTVDGATRSFAKWFEGYSGEMPQRTGYANAIYYYIKNNL